MLQPEIGTSSVNPSRPMPDEKIVSYYAIEQQLKSLAGNILTIVDATFSDLNQREAFKSLIRQSFSKQFNSWQEFYWGGTLGHSVDIDNVPNSLQEL